MHNIRYLILLSDHSKNLNLMYRKLGDKLFSFMHVDHRIETMSRVNERILSTNTSDIRPPSTQDKEVEVVKAIVTVSNTD